LAVAVEAAVEKWPLPQLAFPVVVVAAELR
jgi:hypothetical protein